MDSTPTLSKKINTREDAISALPELERAAFDKTLPDSER